MRSRAARTTFFLLLLGTSLLAMLARPVPRPALAHAAIGLISGDCFAGVRNDTTCLLQGTADASGETPVLPEETVQAPRDTAEPTPGDTTEPPAGTVEPTPEETSQPEPPVGETGTPEDTVEPEPTGPETPETTAPAETVAAPSAATPTARPPIWPTAWPEGTIRIGEESRQPAQPFHVTMGEWLRLGLALAVVALAAAIGSRLLYRLLIALVARRHLDVDDTVLVELKPVLPWWLVAVGFHGAIWWVDFENGTARDLFSDLAFFAYLGVFTRTLWGLVARAVDVYTGRMAAQGQAAAAEKLRPILTRWMRGLLLLFAALVALGRLDFGLSVPTLLLMLVGLTVSLAARNTLTDVIAGFFILVDRPFRIGDRISVKGVDGWAEVVNIGLRTSVLLTRHNVEIIVPNSTIGTNQVINYSYPDSRYRMQTHVGVGFGEDMARARQVMSEAVRQADGVLPDEPVDVLYHEIGDAAMIFRVRWWIDFYSDPEVSFDRVHTSLQRALDEAGIDCPFPTQTLNVDVAQDTVDRFYRAVRGGNGNPGEMAGEEVS